MFKTPLVKICNQLNIEFIGSEKYCITEMKTDSRKVDKGDFFIGLVGDNFDGSEFITKIHHKIKGCLVSRKYFDTNKDFLLNNVKNIIISDNTKQDYLKLANYRVKGYSIITIGITGSFGKTSVKEFLFAALSEKYIVSKSEKNNNNIVGVAHTLNEARLDSKILIIEIGTNHFGEIREIVDLIDLDYAFITAIGNTHLEFFKSKFGVLKEKTDIFKNVKKKIIINKNDELLIKYYKENLNGNENVLFIEDYNQNINYQLNNDLQLKVHYKSNSFDFPYSSFALLVNFVYAMEIAQEFNVSYEKSINSLSNVDIPSNRGLILQSKKFKSKFLFDAYNSNPDSLKFMIDNFNKLFNKSKLFVIGDMLELGSKKDDVHKEIINLLRDFETVFIGEIFYKNKSESNKYFKNVDDFINFIETNKSILENKNVFLKGSNSIRLNKIIEIV